MKVNPGIEQMSKSELIRVAEYEVTVILKRLEREIGDPIQSIEIDKIDVSQVSSQEKSVLKVVKIHAYREPPVQWGVVP
jgi:hypothetical protein